LRGVDVTSVEGEAPSPRNTEMLEPYTHR